MNYFARIFAILLLSSACGLCQTNKTLLGLPVHPYRKVADKYYSVQPLYDWVARMQSKSQRREEITYADRLSRPLTNWFCTYAPYEGVVLRYKVEQVLDEGLLVREARFVPGTGGEGESDPFLLRNYPNASNAIDGQTIYFIAMESGHFKYTDTLGGIRTVPCFDYGTPCDPPPPSPEEKAKQLAVESVRAAAKAADQAATEGRLVKWQQEQADKGEALYQYKLGIRYRDGVGVAKDEAKARELLGKAAAQGEKDAITALAKLPAQ